MTIGGSIALIAIGAILRYAISWSPTGINVPLIGAILMIVGAIGLIIALAFLFSRRRSTTAPPAEVYERRQYREPPVPGGYVEERRYSEPPAPGGYVEERRRYSDPPV